MAAHSEVPTGPRCALSDNYGTRSHRFGRISSAKASQLRDRLGEETVRVLKGRAMLMRPLLLHASSKVVSDAPRRVLHFVFGPRSLPEGLRWRAAV